MKHFLMIVQIVPEAPSHPLPATLVSAITILAFLIIGFFVENYYVSRLTVFSNSIALIAFLNTANRLDWILILYATLGAFAGLLGFIWYVRKEELPIEYYELTFYTYSSAPLGLFIGLSLLFTSHWVLLLPAFAIGAAINSKLVLLLGDVLVPVDDLPLAVFVTRWFLNVYAEIR